MRALEILEIENTKRIDLIKRVAIHEGSDAYKALNEYLDSDIKDVQERLNTEESHIKVCRLQGIIAAYRDIVQLISESKELLALLKDLKADTE